MTNAEKADILYQTEFNNNINNNISNNYDPSIQATVKQPPDKLLSESNNDELADDSVGGVCEKCDGGSGCISQSSSVASTASIYALQPDNDIIYSSMPNASFGSGRGGGKGSEIGSKLAVTKELKIDALATTANTESIPSLVELAIEKSPSYKPPSILKSSTATSAPPPPPSSLSLSLSTKSKSLFKPEITNLIIPKSFSNFLVSTSSSSSSASTSASSSSSSLTNLTGSQRMSRTHRKKTNLTSASSLPFHSLPPLQPTTSVTDVAAMTTEAAVTSSHYTKQPVLTTNSATNTTSRPEADEVTFVDDKLLPIQQLQFFKPRNSALPIKNSSTLVLNTESSSSHISKSPPLSTNLRVNFFYEPKNKKL